MADAQYQSGLIEALRAASPGGGSNNPGVTLLPNYANTGSVINFLRGPRTGLINNPALLKLSSAPASTGSSGSPSGGGGTGPIVIGPGGGGPVVGPTPAPDPGTDPGTDPTPNPDVPAPSEPWKPEDPEWEPSWDDPYAVPIPDTSDPDVPPPDEPWKPEDPEYWGPIWDDPYEVPIPDTSDPDVPPPDEPWKSEPLQPVDPDVIEGLPVTDDPPIYTDPSEIFQDLIELGSMAPWDTMEPGFGTGSSGGSSGGGGISLDDYFKLVNMY